MMKPDRLQVFLTPSWLIPKLGERSWNEKLASGGVGTLRFTTQFWNVTEPKASKRCERAALLQPYLWPISWVMVIPRSKPVSSVITQLHSLLQAPPSCATPLTWLFPSGNTRSYLWEQGLQTLGWTFPGRFPSHAPLVLMRDGQISHLVMYKRRSACRGSESFAGFIFLPHSHTLVREDVMLVDSWISGWSSKKTLLQHYQCQQVFKWHDWQPFSPIGSYEDILSPPTSGSDRMIMRTRCTLMLPPRLMSLNSSEACVRNISIKTWMGRRLGEFVMKKRIWKEQEPGDFNTLFGIVDRFTLLITAEAVNH